MKIVKSNALPCGRVATARNAAGVGKIPVVKAFVGAAQPASVEEYVRAASGALKAHLGWMLYGVRLKDPKTLVVMIETRDPEKAQECFRRIKPALSPLGQKDFSVKLVTIKTPAGDTFFNCDVKFATPVLSKQTAATQLMYAALVESADSDKELLLGSGCIALTKHFAKYGVSAHVLPGAKSADGNPLFMIVGVNKAQVERALEKGYSVDPSAHTITKLPI